MSNVEALPEVGSEVGSEEVARSNKNARYIAVLSDGETFTDVEGSIVVELPDHVDDDEIEDYLREGDFQSRPVQESRKYILTVGDCHEFSNMDDLRSSPKEDRIEHKAKYEIKGHSLIVEGIEPKEVARLILWGMAACDGWIREESFSYLDIW